LTAGTRKGNFPLSYVDAYAAATVKTRGCPLLTGAREFEALEKKGIMTV